MMNPSNKIQIKRLARFSKALCGIYSNRDQAMEFPRLFSNVNMYFIPLPWSFFSKPSIYAEQSHNYAPWSPYRQSINFISERENFYILSSYKITNPERYAGAGHHTELLKGINKEEISKKSGCDMYFHEVSKGTFHGSIEPGEKCIIIRNGGETFVDSKVRIDGKTLCSIDEGYAVSSRHKVWGSENGPLLFKKEVSPSNYYANSWLAD